MSFAVQLANSIEYDELPQFVTDDRYWFEQKLDGVRLAVHIDDGKIEGVNRRGVETDVDRDIHKVLTTINGCWTLDGEWIDDVLWVFDLPRAPGITLESPYRTRRFALEVVLPSLTERTDRIRLLPTHRTPEEKVEIAKWCIANNAEGVMVKDSDGIYTCGLRSNFTLKAKLVTTADCIVTVVGREGKRSVSVAVFEDGKLVDIGSVTVTERMLNTLCRGDVIEVKYLYATADRRLYQPRMLRLRTDKDAATCLIDQLKFGSKQVKQ